MELASNICHLVELYILDMFLFAMLPTTRLVLAKVPASPLGPWPSTHQPLAHQGNQAKLLLFYIFLSMENWFEVVPNGARRFCFLLIQTLPTFWATRILILRIFIFGIFFDPKFPRFPNSRAGPHPFCCNISSATGIVSVGNTLDSAM